MAFDIAEAVKELSKELTESSFKTSESLSKIGSEEVVSAMIGLLGHDYPDTRFIAAKTLGGIADNGNALIPLWDAIHNVENKNIKGDLLSALEGFDISDHYVDVFKLFLFGSFKVSLIAENLLDYKEFTITLRVIRKSRKHWSHYANNVKQDEAFELQKAEIEHRFHELNEYLEIPETES